VRLENELSDALGLEVDLVEKCALKPHIGRYILREVVRV
jgi:predicted nucleotidyltransferase